MGPGGKKSGLKSGGAGKVGSKQKLKSRHADGSPLVLDMQVRYGMIMSAGQQLASSLADRQVDLISHPMEAACRVRPARWLSGSALHYACLPSLLPIPCPGHVICKL
jgi:hypothetical protein